MIEKKICADLPGRGVAAVLSRKWWEIRAA
jgi:hypothetical protein